MEGGVVGEESAVEKSWHHQGGGIRNGQPRVQL